MLPGFGNTFANLHNGRKAQGVVLHILGKHASHDLRHEAPLKGDTVGISRTNSNWTRVSAGPAEVGRNGADAVQAARAKSGQIATLILPADTA